MLSIRKLQFGCLMLLAANSANAFNGAFGGGNGTSTATPYIIQDAADLNAVRNNQSAHYKLDRDIDLTAYLATGAGFSAWGDEGWLPIGTNNAFNGSFNGDGHIFRKNRQRNN